MMNLRQKPFLYTLLTLCFIVARSTSSYAQDKPTSFQFTILKSTGEPQQEVTAQIYGNSEEYHPDEKGIIRFDLYLSPTYARKITFSFPSQKKAASFFLKEEETIKTFYLNSPEDIILFKQQNRIFGIEGLVVDEQQIPISGAIISIQGTGKKTCSDSTGLFRMETGYNHPVTLRADGMENRLIPVSSFLQNPNEPYLIMMTPKGNGRIYSVAEKMPEFPGGGMKAFASYLKRNLQYPEQAQKDSIEGVVGIRFIVETTGEITSPIIVRHLEPSLDSAAVQLIRNMPSWIPACENGKKVRCKYSLPIRFRIPKPQPVHGKIQNTDYLPFGEMKTDSLHTRSQADVPPYKKEESGDSIFFRNETSHTMPVPADTLQSDSTLQSILPVTSVTEEKPKKKNLFARFFRWLSGNKEKNTNHHT